LGINHDRRVTDVETAYDRSKSLFFFNSMFATATTLDYLKDDGSGYPPLRPPLGKPFLVKAFSPTSNGMTSVRTSASAVGWIDADNVPDPSAMGRGLNRILRTRWTEPDA
jgi:hypothetical protein